MAPQHCGVYDDIMSTLCNVHYHLEDVDFSNVRNGKLLGFGASGGAETAPVYISKDNSMEGNRIMMYEKYNGFAKLPGCDFVSELKWKAVACNTDQVPIYTLIFGSVTTVLFQVKLARFIMWTSQSMDRIKISGPGYEVDPIWDDGRLHGLNAG